MENELSLEGLNIASGVVETIVALAVSEVEGVASIGAGNTMDGLRARLAGTQPQNMGVEARVEDGEIALGVRLQAYYGTRLPELAAEVRAACVSAVECQVGLKVRSVDVFVDELVIEE